MPTEQEWAEIARRLQEPFAANEVKQKKGRGGKQLSYIDARAVAARLDAVVGPGNWSFNWEPMVIQRPERGVVWEDQEWKDGEKLPPIKKLAPEPEVDAVCVAKGILTIYGVSKADIGYAGAIEPNKASISNALRRCGALWGIGRYLYGQEQQRPQAQNTSQKESRGQSNGAQRSNGAAATAEAHSVHQGQVAPVDDPLRKAWADFRYVAPLAGQETADAQRDYLRVKYPGRRMDTLTADELWTQSTLLRAGLGMEPHPASGAVELEAVTS